MSGSGAAGAVGGWALTLLDPVPTRFEIGHTYTIGFWVLQHGTHPFDGELGPVGLRFTRANGRSATFLGTPLPEAGHYATSVALPRGEWKVEALQGIFDPWVVGALKVPGDMRVVPVPAPALRGERPEERWGAIRPPAVEPGAVPSYGPAPATALERIVAPAGSPAPDPRTAETASGHGTADEGGTAAGEGATAGEGTAAGTGAARVAGERSAAPGAGVPAYALLIAAAAGAGLAVAVYRLGARRRRQEPDPPPDPAADTIAFP